MEHRSLGAAGPAVSLAGLGCNNFAARIDFEATRAVVHKALDLGVTLFDTADIYGEGGSEEFLGRALGPRRKDVLIATKFGYSRGAIRGSASRAYIMDAVAGSLARLKTDWIDLYQLHRPDPATPIEETLSALDELVRAGKVRHIGCSAFSADRLEGAAETATRLNLARFATCQNELSLLERAAETELVPALQRTGTGFLPYRPLAGGMLTGKYRKDLAPPAGSRFSYTPRQADQYMNEANWRRLERLEGFAAEHSRSLGDLAIAWLAAQPWVTSIIAGATSPAQLEANARALAWRLSPAERAAVGRI